MPVNYTSPNPKFDAHMKKYSNTLPVKDRMLLLKQGVKIRKASSKRKTNSANA